MAEASTTATKTKDHAAKDHAAKDETAEDETAKDDTAKDDTAKDDTPKQQTGEAKPSGDYVLPVVHRHVPANLVDAGFWGGLLGAVALGAIDPPVGVVVGVGVLIARHRSSS